MLQEFRALRLNKLWIQTAGILSFTLVAGIFAYLDFTVLALAFIFLAFIIVISAAILYKQPGTILLIYLLGLPAYTMTLAILFNYTGSVALINALQMWKEAIAFAGLAVVIIHILLKLRLQALHPLDYLVLAYALLNILYLLIPLGPDLTVRLYGFRANAFFVVIYFLGRNIPLTAKLQKIAIFCLVGIGALAGLFVLFEIAALPPNWPARVGLMKYLAEFYGVSPIGHYGLTWTFETSTGLRRYSAFFSNPLELASSALITAPAAFFLCYAYRPWSLNRLLARTAFGLIVISLLLAISRASLVAFFIEIIIASIWIRKRHIAVLAFFAALAGFSALLLFGEPGMVDFIWETITFQNPSSQGHVQGWLQGAYAILANPFGLGLGNSGHIGSRFGTQIGGENQFVIIGVDLGIPGLLLYFLILLFSIYFAFQAFRHTQGYAKALAFTAAAAKLGLLVPSFTSNIEVYIFAMFTSWWLVGFSVQELKKSTQFVVDRQNRQKATGDPSQTAL